MSKLISVKRISENIFEIEYKNLFRTKKKLVFTKGERRTGNIWKDLDTGSIFPIDRILLTDSLDALEKELKIGETYEVTKN